MVIELIYNLSTLVALSVLSGFIDNRFERQSKSGQILQGILFGLVAIIGMMYPFRIVSGVIFDGRSIVLSLCTLFFGPITGTISTLLAIAFRIYLGGGGTLTGILVAISSFFIGWLYNYLVAHRGVKINKLNLYWFGFIVNGAMMILFQTLPSSVKSITFQTITLTVMVVYPFITLVIGKVLQDSAEKKDATERLKLEIANLKKTKTELRGALQHLNSHLENSPLATIEFDNKLRIKQWSKRAEEVFGWKEEEVIGKSLADINLIVAEETNIIPEQRDLSKAKDSSNYVVYKNYRKNGSIIVCYWYLSYLTDESNTITSIYAIISDRTSEILTLDKLTDTEKHFRTLADSGQALIWTSGLDKKCDYFNKPWLEFTGRKLEQEIGDGWAEGVHPDDFGFCLKTYVEAFEKRNKFSMEYRIKHVSGQYRWILDDGSPRYNSKGEFLGYIGFCLDITSRKITEAALRDSKNLLDKTLQSITDAVLLIRPLTREIIDCNKAVESVFGYKQEELINHNTELLHIDSLHYMQFGKMSNPQLKSNGVFRTIFRMKHKSGKVIVTENTVTEIKDDNGNVSEYVSVIRDITGRIEIETRLRESEEKFRSLFNDHSAIKLLIDPADGRIVDANKAAVIFYGYALEELKNMPISKINILSENEISGKIEKIRDLGSGHFFFKHQLSNGEIRDVENFSSCVTLNGKTYLHSIVHDVTEKMKAERELEQYRNHLEKLVEERTEEIDAINQQLVKEIELKNEKEAQLNIALEKEKELNELKSRFISTASHEFKTPLTAIFSSAELIQRYKSKWDESKLETYLERIKGSVTYLTKLTDDVLVVNKIEAGKVPFSPIPFNLKELIERVIEDLQIMTNDNHEITFDYKPGSTEVVLDPKQTELMIYNLMSNAIKYSPKGGAVILSVESNNGELSISVKDSGIGIPKEDIPRLFETFHRATNTSNIQGTGLGLSIVKHAVNLHNGRIEVESSEEGGTLFNIRIPLIADY